jgi:receptor protein-tyrosine kinase
MSRQRGSKVFAIVSPSPGEGKSSTAANLAVALAQTDKRVLAISADLRQPGLHRYFRVDNEVGLADVLLGEVPLQEATLALSTHLWFVASGRPPVRPGELLQSPRMPQLIEEERGKYDFILIDCPPVLGLADALAITPFVDAVLLVARAERTKRGAITHAAELLEQVGSTITAGILNDVPLSRRASSYGYGYGYGYGETPDASSTERSSGLRRRIRAPAPDAPSSGNGIQAEPSSVQQTRSAAEPPSERSETGAGTLP